MRIFVTGIDTGTGKTIVSAILVKALHACYWKCVQSGVEDGTDSETVRMLTGDTTCILPERYVLHTPASPHYAAGIDGVEISIDDFQVPQTDRHIVMEGAGGVLVPLNKTHLIIDLIHRLADTTIVVSKNYLGSINHTLLTVEALRTRGIPVAGIIFNGEKTPSTESIILHYTGLPCLGQITWHDTITPGIIDHYANAWKDNLKSHLNL